MNSKCAQSVNSSNNSSSGSNSSNSRSKPVPTVFFGTLVQHFWFIVLQVATAAEKQWLRQVSELIEKQNAKNLYTKNVWQSKEFFSVVNSFLNGKVALYRLKSDEIAPPYWFYCALLCRLEDDHNNDDRRNGKADSAKTLHESRYARLEESIEPQIAAMNSYVDYAERVSKKSSTKAHRLKKPKKIYKSAKTLPCRDLWRHLADGCAQRMLTYSFAFALALFPDRNDSPMRWSSAEPWYLYDIYLIDGVFVGSQECTPDCVRRHDKSDQRKECSLQCWRRPHSWIMLLLVHLETKRQRAVHIDITSAALGLDSKRFADMPLNAAFVPHIWPDSDWRRDPCLRPADQDRHAHFDELWQCVEQHCDKLTDSQVEELRRKNVPFYAFAGAHRLRHYDLCYEEIYSTLKVAPVTLHGSDKAQAKPFESIAQVKQRLGVEASYIDTATAERNISSADKILQAYLVACGIDHLSQAFLSVTDKNK